MKRVFILHGLGKMPKDNWYMWLRNFLEDRGIDAKAPQLPNGSMPDMEEWLSFLRGRIGRPDLETYIVAHGVSSQLLLRYLEELSGEEKIGGALMAAGFVRMREGSLEKALQSNLINQQQMEILRKMEENEIDLSKVAKHSERFVSIFSGNDPYVGFENADAFKDELRSKIIIIPRGGHFTEADGYTELHSALNEILKLIEGG